nr:MAG TPA: hypothetical protein [Caudoviricetes sp.]
MECNLYLSPKKSLLNYFFPNFPIHKSNKTLKHDTVGYGCGLKH